uniref:Uncharacterized protein n=1 Tax=Romanomermis culicivorax TaxID=13658 RepID=A0A915IGT1_ROMCU
TKVDKAPRKSSATTTSESPATSGADDDDFSDDDNAAGVKKRRTRTKEKCVKDNCKGDESSSPYSSGQEDGERNFMGF